MIHNRDEERLTAEIANLRRQVLALLDKRTILEYELNLKRNDPPHERRYAVAVIEDGTTRIELDDGGKSEIIDPVGGGE